MTSESADWVPPQCTLPSVEQPLRVAEFDDLFATGLRGLERLTPTRLRLRLDTAFEAAARDLTDRETSCCSFFAFDYHSAGDDELLVDVTVPSAYVGVLDALATRAAGVSS